MPGAIKLSRIPYGFFEKEMWSYFSQFGRVERLKLFRSKKSGNSKGFAFVQFAYESVAKIVSETMNNYLMFDKLLKCQFIAESKIQPSMFKNWRRVMIPRLGEEKHTRKVNSFKDDAHVDKSRRRLHAKLVKRNKVLQSMGVNYQFKIPPLPIVGKTVRAGTTSASDPDVTVTGTVDNTLPSSYSLLVDTSDDEIELKTPPKSIRKRKLSQRNNDKTTPEENDNDNDKDIGNGEDDYVVSAQSEDDEGEEKARQNAIETADFIKLSSSSGILVNKAENGSGIEKKKQKKKVRIPAGPVPLTATKRVIKSKRYFNKSM